VFARIDPHTNWLFSEVYIPIGVGIKALILDEGLREGQFKITE